MENPGPDRAPRVVAANWWFYVTSSFATTILACVLWAAVFRNISAGALHASDLGMTAVATLAAASALHGWRSKNRVFGYAGLALIVVMFLVGKVMQ